MAVTQEERTARLAEKRQELGEQELRHTVQPGTRKKLTELMAWYGVEEVSEAVQLLVMNAKPQEIPPAPPRQPGKSETIRHYFRQGMRDRLAELASGLGAHQLRALHQEGSAAAQLHRLSGVSLPHRFSCSSQSPSGFC